MNSTGEIFISTDLVEDIHKSDFWREASRPFYETTPEIGNESQGVEGTMRTRQVAELWIGSITFNAQRYNRDRRIIAESCLDQYLIAVITAGEMTGDFAGTSVSARCGDICVLDLAQALKSEVTTGGTLSALIPRRTLARATGHANLHGLLFKAHLPMTKLLTAYLGALNDLGGVPSDDEAFSVQDALVTILAAAIRGEQPHGAGDRQALSMVLRQRALDFIDYNINNPNLGPDSIIQHLNVSRAHLYRAFAEDGGIASIIRNRRLDAALLELLRTGSKARSVSEISFSLGFSSAAHFSRCFRTRFGLAPNEARREGRTRQLPVELQTQLMKLNSKWCPTGVCAPSCGHSQLSARSRKC